MGSLPTNLEIAEPVTTIEMTGFWKRPVCRVYSYNLDLGENYYSPQRDYISSSSSATGRGGRGETPGPLSYSERIARKWIEGDQDRERRARTEARPISDLKSPRELLASSDFRSSAAATSAERREMRETMEKTTTDADILLATHRDAMSRMDEEESRRRYGTPRANDDVFKRIVDIRMSPWRGAELETEYRARLSSLNRELEDITRNAMSYRPRYAKTAADLAKDALRESSTATSSFTKKVVMDSSRSFY